MHRSFNHLIKALGLLAVLMFAPLVQAVPTITSQSHSGIFNINYGSALTMSVVASGSGGLTYQWYSSGTPIPGATLASYAIAFVDETMTTNYRVRVTDSSGYVESSFMVPVVQNIPALAFVSQPGPTSQTVAAGGSVIYHFTMSGGMGALTSEKVYVSSSGAEVNAFFVTLTRGSNGLHTGTIRMTSVEASQGGTFYLRMVSSLYGTATSSPFSLTVEPTVDPNPNNRPPVITVQPVSVSVDYADDATLNVGITGSNLSYQWYRNGVALAGASATSSTFFDISVTAGDIGTYTLTVTNSHGSVTSNPATIGINPPVWMTQPTSKSVNLEGLLTLESEIVNTGSHVAYQWYREGVAISGATSRIYSITANAGSGGNYIVTASHVGGTITSNPANVTVNYPRPSITAQPVSRSVNAGASTSFSVTATTPFNASGSTIAYQWFKDGSAITGATSTTYSIPSVSASHAGTYYVLVANTYGTEQSQNVTLAVTQTFAGWATAAGLAAGQNGQTDDPDRDGASNLLEYALGLNPTSPSASALPAAVVESGQNVVRFTRARAATGVTLQVLISSDLVTWTPGPAPVVESSTALTETCTVTLPAGQSRYFLRLEATSP